MENFVVSIYIPGDVLDKIDPDVREAIHDMQAEFGFDQMYRAPFDRIRGYISQNYGERLAARIQQGWFICPQESA